MATRRPLVIRNDNLVGPLEPGDTISWNILSDVPVLVSGIVAGANITIDNTDPTNPIISATVSGGGASLPAVMARISLGF